VHPPTMAIPKFIQLILPLPPLSTMVQSRLGVAQVREAQVHLPTVAIPKFIQMMKPLPLLSQMVHSQLGVTQLKEEEVHPLAVAIPKFIQLLLPSEVRLRRNKLNKFWYSHCR
jgi:hypothetical protein